MGSFKSELDIKSTIYTCVIDKFLDYDFYKELCSLISKNENNSANLKYVFFVNHNISRKIREFLIDFCSTSSDKVDIDFFKFYGIEFRVERNKVSDMNIIRPDVKLLVPQYYHKIIMLNIQ